MAYIRVEHSKFSDAAESIENYIAFMKNKMNNAQEEVNALEAGWQGTDSVQFKTQWSKVTNGESTYGSMIKVLDSYAKFLRYAESRYKDAQAKAVNRANNLPRW